MAILYDAATLLATIRNVASIPDAHSLGSDDEDLLRHINEALRWKIAPIIIQTREEYLVQTVRESLAGRTRFRIPNRAIGNRLRDILFLDANGSRELWINPIQREELGYYNAHGSGRPCGYFLEGNYIQLVPTGGSYSGQIEISFFMRPSALRPVEETRRVESVDLNTGIVTLTEAIPAGWDAAEVLFDIHSPDSGAEIKFWDMVASGILGTSMTFGQSIAGTEFGFTPVAAGDYICLQNECGLIGMPDDMIPLLAQAVALRVAVADGDTEQAKLHSSMIQDETQEVRKVLENRVEGRPWRVSGRGGIRGTSFGG